MLYKQIIVANIDLLRNILYLQKECNLRKDRSINGKNLKKIQKNIQYLNEMILSWDKRDVIIIDWMMNAHHIVYRD